MAAEIISSTTQQFLDIHDITNNFVIMKDGTVSIILAVDAMNFGLLAEEEQDAVMYAYAGLLNSLNYTIQIVINSQTKDVTSYLQLLKDQESTASNETIRRRIRQYREFVGNLIHDRNVLDKKFYVVIPANSIELGFAGAKSVLPGSSKFDISSIERSMLLEKAQNVLDPRRDHLIAQFARIGLFSRQLTTQEIIQLFYIQYNPEAAEGQQIGESSSYASPLVQASIQGSVMNTDTVVPTAAPAAPTPPVQTPPAPQQSAPAMPAAPVAPATMPAETATPVAPQPEAPISPPASTTGEPMSATTPQSSITPPATPAMPPTPAMPATGMPDPSSMPGANQASTTPAETMAPNSTMNMPDARTSSGGGVNTTPPAPASEATPGDMDIQADLNETIKQMGVPDAPTSQAGTTADTQNPATIPGGLTSGTTSQQDSTTAAKPATNPSGDLPPLPEI